MASEDFERAADALIKAFCDRIAIPPDPKRRFGSNSLRVLGTSDGTEGVQWNAWVDWTDASPSGFAGVNLEGKQYDGWPVGRLIHRELDRPRLMEIVPGVTDPSSIQVLWYRDAWQIASRPQIEEKVIGQTTLDHLTAADWKRMLTEAAECLGPGFQGRGRQIVTPKAGAKEFPVSPHLQFRVRFRPFNPFSVESWSKDLDRVMGQLEPLHRFVQERVRK